MPGSLLLGWSTVFQALSIRSLVLHGSILPARLDQTQGSSWIDLPVRWRSQCKRHLGPSCLEPRHRKPGTGLECRQESLVTLPHLRPAIFNHFMSWEKRCKHKLISLKARAVETGTFGLSHSRDWPHFHEKEPVNSLGISLCPAVSGMPIVIYPVVSVSARFYQTKLSKTGVHQGTSKCSSNCEKTP
jgi:hypothetical protein